MNRICVLFPALPPPFLRLWEERARNTVLCFLLVSSAFASGCSRSAEREAEKRVNTVLTNYIGPADKWDTRVRSDSAGAVMRGRFKSISIVGKNVRVDPNMSLEDLTLDFEAVEVDTKAQRLNSVGKATFSCRLRDVVLSRYCRKRRPNINGLDITFEENNLVVHAKPDALGLFKVPITVAGKLKPRGTAQLDFDPNKANLSILPVPEAVLDYLASKLNPAIDLTHLVAPLRIERTEINGSLMTVSGSIAPDDLLKLGK